MPHKIPGSGAEPQPSLLNPRILPKSQKSEPNRLAVRVNDHVFMRIYGDSFIGTFKVAGLWKPLPKSQQHWTKVEAGVFPMTEVELWDRPLPQSLIIGDLSNHDHRKRIVRLDSADSIKIETAKGVYARLGFGGADGIVLVLEKGVEEAIKPSLVKLGLRLADNEIRQQFMMGIGIGRSDLICLDKDGDLVVLELKRGLTSDEAVGQVLRYVGWIRENIATPGQKVHGWIVAGDYDEHLRLAAKAANITLILVRLC